MATSRRTCLSARELQVLLSLAQGRSVGEIAESLQVSVRSVAPPQQVQPLLENGDPVARCCEQLRAAR
jgi:hypothetical protein